MSYPAYPQNQNMWSPYAPAPQPVMNPSAAMGVPQNMWAGNPAPMPQQVPQNTPAQPVRTEEGFPNVDFVAWIQGGEAAAKAFHVDPGKTAMLIDSEPDRRGNSLFFLKTVDVYGRPKPLEAFRYEVFSPEAEDAAADFVTRKEFEEWKKTVQERRPAPSVDETNEEVT